MSNGSQLEEDYTAAIVVLPFDEETKGGRGTLDFSLDADGHIVTTLGAAKGDACGPWPGAV